MLLLYGILGLMILMGLSFLSLRIVLFGPMFLAYSVEGESTVVGFIGGDLRICVVMCRELFFSSSFLG